MLPLFTTKTLDPRGKNKVSFYENKCIKFGINVQIFLEGFDFRKLWRLLAQNIIILSSFRVFLHQVSCIEVFLVPKRKFLPSRYQRISRKVPTETYDESNGKADDGDVLHGPLNKAGFYELNRKPRGICIIINNTFAAGEVKTCTGKVLEERMGTNVDKDRLKKLFEWLDFQVYVKTDLATEDMKDLFQNIGNGCKISENPEENLRLQNLLCNNSDCLVFCILTHGFKYGLYGADGEYLETSEIMKYLSADYCPHLAGKPKLAFIQACRGEEDINFMKTNSPSTSRARSYAEELNLQNQGNGAGKKISSAALTDILIYDATAIGKAVYLYLYLDLFTFLISKKLEVYRKLFFAMFSLLTIVREMSMSLRDLFRKMWLKYCWATFFYSQVLRYCNWICIICALDWQLLGVL